MNKFIFFICCLVASFLPKTIHANALLKIGDKVQASYSKEKFACTVIGFYGELVTLKTVDENTKKLFHVPLSQIEGNYQPLTKQISKEDEQMNSDVLIDLLVEAAHPNGEWYVGKVIEKYGKFLKVKLGEKDWAPVWVSSLQYRKNFKVDSEVVFYDYRKKQVAVITNEGILKNRKNVTLGRVYSNGKVYNAQGNIVATIQPDGSITTNDSILVKTNYQFKNGLEYLTIENKSICTIRIKSSSIYHPDRPDIVNLFFDPDQLKGNMRVCGGLFFLFKDQL